MRIITYKDEMTNKRKEKTNLSVFFTIYILTPFFSTQFFIPASFDVIKTVFHIC